MAGKRKPLDERFWKRVAKTEECWLWTGYVNPNGYAQMGVGKYEKVYVHHVSFEMHVGPIPEGAVIRHRCDVRHCVRPDHLVAGTQQDNINDMWERKRAHYQQRDACIHGHRYTPETVYMNGNKRVCKICRRAIDKKRRSK